jgi:hypothetical protein
MPEAALAVGDVFEHLVLLQVSERAGERPTRPFGVAGSDQRLHRKGRVPKARVVVAVQLQAVGCMIQIVREPLDVALKLQAAGALEMPYQRVEQLADGPIQMYSVFLSS